MHTRVTLVTWWPSFRACSQALGWERQCGNPGRCLRPGVLRSGLLPTVPCRKSKEGSRVYRGIALNLTEGARDKPGRSVRRVPNETNPGDGEANRNAG